MSKLFALLSLIRIKNLIIATLAIIIACYLLNEPLSTKVIACGLIVICCMSSGYIINDLLDVESDTVNQKKNYIANKIITTKQAHFLNLFFIVLYVLCSSFLNSESRFFLFFCILPFLYSYNFFFKKYALIGNFFVALMLGSVFVFVELALKGNIESMYVVGGFAFGLNFIREIIKDIYDVKGDRFQSMRTLPIVFGTNLSIAIVKIFILIFSAILIVHAYFYSVKWYFLSMIILVELPLYYSLFLLSRSSNKRSGLI